MRIGTRLLTLAAASLLLAGCFSGVQPTLPIQLQPVRVTPQPTPPPTAALAPPSTPATAEQQRALPLTAPNPTPEITQPADAAVEIHSANAVELQPAAIFPLFRRGLLHSVRWSPDGGSLVVETSQGLQVLSADGLKKRYSLPDIRPIQYMDTNDLLVMTPDGLSCLDLAEGGLVPVQAAGGSPLILPAAGQAEEAYALSPDGALWANAPEANILQVQNLAGGDPARIELVSKTLIPLSIRRLAFAADSSRVYALADRADGETELIAVQVPEEEGAPWQQVYTIYGARTLPFFSPNGELMAVETGERLDVLFSADGSTWAELSRRIVRELGPQSASILTTQAVSFLPDGKQVGVLYNGAVSDQELHRDSAIPGTLIIYNTGSPSVARTINNLPAWVVDFSFSPDGLSFLTTSRDGMLRLWDTETGALLGETDTPYDTDATPAVRADGRLVAYSHVESISLVDPATGQQVAALGEYPGAVSLEANFAGEDTLAVFVELSSYDFIDTYDIATRRFQKRYTDLGACNFNTGGSLMACFDGIYKIFDLRSGQLLLDIVPQGSGTEIAMSPDGQQVAACTRGAELVYLYPARAGARARALRGERTGSCGNLVFSPGGDRLASSSGLVWDTASGEILARFSPSAGEPVAVNASGDVLVLFPNLVDLSSGQDLGALQAVPDPRALFFPPGGSQMVLITRRGIEFWSVSAAP